MESRLRVGPVPEWVVHEPYPDGAGVDDTFVSDGVCLLVRDIQVDLTGSGETHNIRVAHRVLTAEGASLVAQFSGTFDPALQEMVVHYLTVRRGDRIQNYARLEAFELMRREQNLERRMLDGRRTASLILPDVRPGDIVEQCWTIYSDNPVLRGFFCEWMALEGPAALSLRHRVRAPAERRIVERVYGAPFDAAVHDTDGVRDRRWRIDTTERVQLEALTPPWMLRLRTVQAADERSWEDISRHFAPHYAPDTIPPSLPEKAAQLKAEHPEDTGARLMAALLFVQERLRYLSLSLGEGGLIPRPLNQVIEQGYGDCKDSARLFVTMAKLCGLEATPALVSTQYGPAIDGWLPTTAAFDHCIVRVNMDGKVHWIDPTRRSRAATIDQYVNAQSGWALPLTPAGSALERMPELPPTLSLDVHERIVLSKRLSQPARFELKLDYYGLYADWLGDQIANQGLSTVAEHMRKRYLNDWPTASVATPLRVEEDRAAYRLSLIGSYDIARPWKEADKGVVQCFVTDHELVGELHRLQAGTERRQPIFLGRPRILKRKVEAVHPERWGAANHLYNKEVQGLHYWKQILTERPNIIVQEQKLTVTNGVLDAGNIGPYHDIVDATHRNILRLGSESAGGSVVNEKLSWRGIWWIIWIIVMVFSAIARIAATAPSDSEGTQTETLPPDLPSTPSPETLPSTSAPSQFQLDRLGSGEKDSTPH